MHFGINPFVVQAKLQLNLKKDEAIIDFCYCISDDFQNQCIWMMDEKLQVWRCTNELNPNSCNWTTVKVTMFDSLYYKKFFKPSMTFSDFHTTSTLNSLDAFKALGLESGQKHEFIFAYNGTVTKVFVVK